MDGAAGAVKVDRTSGCSERTAFVERDQSGDRVYVIAHEPASAPRGAVLVCSPILVDTLVNYSRERHLARALAEAGLAALRFHYRGCGNSDRDASEITLEMLEDDARWAADHLQGKAGGRPLAFVGTRFGALTALAAASGRPGAPVVLVEPITDFRRWLRDAGRAKRMNAMAAGRPEASTSVENLLARHGYLDVVGEVLHSPLYDSLEGRDALGLLVPGDRPVLVVQMGGGQLRPELSALVQRCESLGWKAQHEIVDIKESWWFREGRNDPLQVGLTAPVQAWLDVQLGLEVTP